MAYKEFEYIDIHDYMKISRETWLKIEIILPKENMTSILCRKTLSLVMLCNYYIFDISVIIFAYKHIIRL